MRRPQNKMDNFRRLHKQENVVPRYHGSVAGSFLARSHVLFMPIIATVLAVAYWQIRLSYVSVRTTEIRIEQLTRLESTTAHHHEVLAMSAMTAAVTKGSEQSNRHDELGPRVEATVREISHIFKEDTVDAVNATRALRGFVDDKLDATERKALSLARQGKHNNAIALLQSPEYLEQKQAYEEGMRTFVENVRSVMEDRLDSRWERIRIASTTAGIALSNLPSFS